MSDRTRAGRDQRDESIEVAEGRSPAWASPAGLVLITSLLVGAFALVSSALARTSPLTNSSEWALFLLTLAVLAPAAVAGGRTLAHRVDAASGPRAVAELAAIAAIGILGVLIAARGAYALGKPSSTVILALVPAWAAALALATHRSTRGKPLIPAGLAGRAGTLGDVSRPAAWMAIAFPAGLGLLAFFPAHFFHADELAISLALAAALLYVHQRRRPAAPRWIGLLLDSTVVVLVIMTVTDVSGYQEYLRSDARAFELDHRGLLLPKYLAFIHRMDQGFVLATLNDMRHGRTLLVDTSSQYGVGVFYVLAGFFAIAPLGYGALGLLTSFVTGLQFALAYGVLRLAGVARMLAIAAVVAAVLGLVMGVLGSYNDYPSKGGLRYGIPWLIVVLALLAARWPHRRQIMWAASIALVACASVWSFETFAYAGATYTAVIAFEAGTCARGRRLRAFVSYIASALAACAAAHMILATSTRVLVGAWPDWSTYIAYVQTYSGEGSPGFQVSGPWTPALPMLLVCFASLICLAALVARGHEILLTRRPTLIAIAAVSGLGLASSSYWVGNSASFALFFIGLPVMAVIALWLALAEDASARVPSVLKLAALAAGFWLAATIATSGWQDTQGKWRRTALAHALPWTGDERSLPDAVSRLWHNPPSDRRSVPAQQLLDRHLPPGAPALIIMEPQLTVETLMRDDRINALPIGHPEQDNLVPDEVDPKVISTVNALRPGTLMLTQPATWDTPVKNPAVYAPDRLVRVQRLALDRIRSRFRLEIIDRAPPGLAIVRLRARAAGSR